MKNWRFQTYERYKKSDEYFWRFWCGNCQERLYIYIKKGYKAKEIIPEVVCLNCGCANEPRQDAIKRPNSQNR